MALMNDIPTLHGRDLALLPALDALLRTRSVTRAAEALDLSQPAVSRVLSRLRLVLDDPLLVRVGGHWRLTPRAEQLVEQTAALLRDAEALYRPPSFEPASSTRHFRVAIPDLVGVWLLPPLFEELARRAPTCTLTVVPWPSGPDQLDRLDLAIASEPAVFPAFRMQPLFDDVDLLAFRAGDPCPEADAYFSRSHVAVVPNGFARDPVDDWLDASGITRRIGMVVPSYLQATHVVASTSLLAILPRRLLVSLRERFDLAAVDTGVSQQPDQQWLLHPPQLTSDPANNWLRELVQQVCADQGAA